MKLSEIKGEDAIDVLVDIIDPITVISADKAITEGYGKLSRLEFIKLLLKSHKREVIEIMAGLDRTPVDEYEVNLITLPSKLAELISDPALASFFPSAGQTMTSSGSATENTEEEEK